MNSTQVYIVGAVVACLLLSLTMASLVPGKSEPPPLKIRFPEESEPSYLKIHKIPERHNDLTVLLEDLQKGTVTANYVTQILLMREIENEGIFLLWKDVDTFGDRVLVHKATREQEQEFKKMRYEQIQQIERR